ncbi:DNA polymerase epsilon, subunit B like protein, partial [Aduncisulcus paluster]
MNEDMMSLFLGQEEQLKISFIRSLSLSEADKIDIIMGYIHLSWDEAGERVLVVEDETGKIELQLYSETIIKEGTIANNIIIIAEGKMDLLSKKFVVRRMTVPLAEPPSITRTEINAKYGSSGDPLVVSLKKHIPSCLRSKLPLPDDSTVAVLCECWLDDDKTFNLLDKYFTKCEKSAFVPEVTVLTGNFSKFAVEGEGSELASRVLESRQYMSPSSEVLSISEFYIQLFTKLATIVSKNKLYCQRSHFIIVPGPHDPTPFPGVFPLFPMFEPIIAPLQRVVRSLEFCGNPMIIQIGHTRIGIVRHNLINSITQDAVFPHDLHLDTEKDDDEDDATLLDLFGEDSEGSDGKEEEEEVRGRGKGRGRGRGRGGGKYDLESILGSASITGSSKTSSSSRKKSKNSTKHHRSSKPSKKQADLLDIKAEAEKNKMVDVSAMISLMDAEEEQSGLGDTSVRCVSP